ncbi:hypothetical protein C7M52_02495 [Mixta theicola]|nr:hypothetical protein [Mixta theicola]QHM76519.1 hypothetical protein C7M52_02495 [Mixta theicola]
MTEYLKKKWLQLRMFHSRHMFEINYRILRNTERLLRRTQEELWR